MEETNIKILVADDEEGIRDVFSMIIESTFDCKIFQAKSASSAIETIQQNGEMDLIFCDYNMGIDNGGDLYQFLRKNEMTTPFALVSTYRPDEIEGFENFETDHPNNTYYHKPFSSDEVIEYINKIFEGVRLNKSKNNKFFKVGPDRFMRLNSDKKAFNVYIHLSKKKYVKIMDREDSPDFDTIKKYAAKGANYIYLEKGQYEIFETSVMESIFKRLENLNNAGTVEEQTKLVMDSIESIQGLIKSLGVNERTIELITNVLGACEEIISKDSKLSDLLKLLGDKDGYIKDHAYLTSFLSCSIADKMDWKTEGIWKNIIFASLFQNISLESDKEAKVFKLDSDQAKSFDERTINRIKFHPQDSVRMLQKVGDRFSEDTFKMIQNHHEFPDGGGFPRGLDSKKVSQLEALFIIASNFAHVLIECKELKKASLIAQNYNESFNEGSYKKAYQGFLKTFQELR